MGLERNVQIALKVAGAVTHAGLPWLHMPQILYYLFKILGEIQDICKNNPLLMESSLEGATVTTKNHEKSHFRNLLNRYVDISSD
jgi:hypothetical protein